MTSVIMDIIARDNASATFLKVGAEAEALSKKVSTTGSRIGNALKVGAAVGLAAVVTLGGASVELASKFEDSQKRLEAALKASGTSFDQLKGPIAAADKQMEALGFTNIQTADAIANLTVATKNPTKSIQLLGVAADLARFKHIDLAEAATAVGKAMSGNLRPIKQLGIDLPVAASSAVKVANATEKLKTAQDNYNFALATYQKTPTVANYNKMEVASKSLGTAQENLNKTTDASNVILKTLSDRLGGQAQAAASTLAGKAEVLKTRLEDIGIKIGTVLIPPLLKMVDGISSAVSWMEKHSTLAKTLAGILGGVLVVAIGHVVTAWLAANLAFIATPIGAVITGIVALVAALVLLWVKWNTVWNAIKTHRGIAITIAALLAMLLPFTLVIAALFLLAKNWSAVWNGIKTASIAIWNALTAAWTNTYNTIVSTGQKILDWFKALPGRILSFFSTAGTLLINTGQRFINGLLNGITGAAVAVWNWFQRLPQTVVNFAVGGLNLLADLGSRFINNIVSGLGNAIGSVISWFKDLPGKILSALGIASPPAWAISAGEWIIKGVLKGAGSAGSHLVKFFGGLASKAWQGIMKIPSFLGKLGSSIGGGFIPGGPHGSVPANVIAEQAYAASLFPSFGWNVGDQLGALISLWNEESGWNPGATNASSGAYGIPQAWPAEKLASAGADWRTNPATQILWGLNYIKQSYGSPAAAWAFETSHTPNWYGGGLPPTVFNRPTLIGVGESGAETVTVQRGDTRGGTLSADAIADAVAAALSGATFRFDGDGLARLVTKKQTAYAVRGGRR